MNTAQIVCEMTETKKPNESKKSIKTGSSSSNEALLSSIAIASDIYHVNDSEDLHLLAIKPVSLMILPDALIFDSIRLFLDAPTIRSLASTNRKMVSLLGNENLKILKEFNTDLHKSITSIAVRNINIYLFLTTVLFLGLCGTITILGLITKDNFDEEDKITNNEENTNSFVANYNATQSLIDITLNFTLSCFDLFDRSTHVKAGRCLHRQDLQSLISQNLLILNDQCDTLCSQLKQASGSSTLSFGFSLGSGILALITMGLFAKLIIIRRKIIENIYMNDNVLNKSVSALPRSLMNRYQKIALTVSPERLPTVPSTIENIFEETRKLKVITSEKLSRLPSASIFKYAKQKLKKSGLQLSEAMGSSLSASFP